MAFRHGGGDLEADDLARGGHDLAAITEPQTLDVVHHLGGAVLIAGERIELDQHLVDPVRVAHRYLGEAGRVVGLETVKEPLDPFGVEGQTLVDVCRKLGKLRVVVVARLPAIGVPVVVQPAERCGDLAGRAGRP